MENLVSHEFCRGQIEKQGGVMVGMMSTIFSKVKWESTLDIVPKKRLDKDVNLDTWAAHKVTLLSSG